MRCINMSRKFPLRAVLACSVFLSFQYWTFFTHSVGLLFAVMLYFTLSMQYHMILILVQDENIMTNPDLCYMTPSVIGNC